MAARRTAWPIPWTAEDYRTTWLAPERLLLFVQIAEPDSAWEASLTIDGRTVELRKAYSAVRTAPRTFVGFYADLSLIEPGREHTLELQLPHLRGARLTLLQMLLEFYMPNDVEFAVGKRVKQILYVRAIHINSPRRTTPAAAEAA